MVESHFPFLYFHFSSLVTRNTYKNNFIFSPKNTTKHNFINTVQHHFDNVLIFIFIPETLIKYYVPTDNFLSLSISLSSFFIFISVFNLLNVFFFGASNDVWKYVLKKPKITLIKHHQLVLNKNTLRSTQAFSYICLCVYIY